MIRLVLGVTCSAIFLLSSAAITATPEKSAVVAKPAPGAPAGNPATTLDAWFSGPWPATVDALDLASREFLSGFSSTSQRQWLDMLPSYAFSPSTSSVLEREFGTSRLFTASRLPAQPGIDDFAITAPPRRHTRKDGSSVAWDRITSRWTIESGTGTISHRVEAPRLHAEDKRLRIDMGNASYDVTTHASAALLFYGDGAVTAGSLRIQDKRDGGRLSLDNLAASVHIAPDGRQVRVEADLRLQTLRLFGQVFDNLQLRMHVEGLDRAAVEAFNAHYMQELARRPSASPNGSRQSAAIAMFGGLGWAAMQRGATLVLDDASYSQDGQTASVLGQFHADPVALEAFPDREGLAKKLTGHLELTLPVTLVRHMTDMISQRQSRLWPTHVPAPVATMAKQVLYEAVQAQLLASYHFRLQGDRFVSSIDLRDGVLFANGKPVSLSAVAAATTGGPTPNN